VKANTCGGTASPKSWTGDGGKGRPGTGSGGGPPAAAAQTAGASCVVKPKRWSSGSASAWLEEENKKGSLG